MPYTKPDQNQSNAAASQSRSTPGIANFILHPLLLLLFALLGATVTVSDGLEKTPLGHWLPWLNPAVRIILTFLVLIGLAIAVVHLVIWIGQKFLQIHPNLLRVLTFSAVLVLIILNAVVLYAVTRDPREQSVDNSRSPGSGIADTTVVIQSFPATTACPGEELSFVGTGRFKDQINVLPGKVVYVDFVLQNTGSVEWRNRYLQRWGQHDNPNDLRSDARIPILVTPRTKQTVVRVQFISPEAPNEYSAYFKVVNEKGEFCYPLSDPLEAKFTVVDQSDLNP